MSNTNIDDLSREDLLRIIQRDRFVKEQLTSRVASLVHENLELIALIQEAQQEAQQQPSSNGEVSSTTAESVDVTS